MRRAARRRSGGEPSAQEEERCSSCVHRLPDGCCEAFLLPCEQIGACGYYEVDDGTPRPPPHTVVISVEGKRAAVHMRGCCERFRRDINAQIEAFGWDSLPPQDSCPFCGGRVMGSVISAAAPEDLARTGAGENGTAKVLTAQNDADGIVVKGGEKKMASEWEELMKLPKEDLIIQLVYWKNMYGIIRVSEDDDCPYPYAEPKARYEGSLMFPGEVTTHEWAVRIAKYAKEHFDGEAFDPTDLMYYGLDEDQCDEICDELGLNGEPGRSGGDSE